VFCVHCQKALGPFRYVREEVEAATSRYERVAHRVTRFVGQPQFFAVHVVWFAVWVLLNAGVIAVVRKFDDYPFNLLGILLAIEAILITGFILFSQNRQQEQADKLAELEYEVNVRSYREIQEVKAMVKTVMDRLDTIAPHPTGYPSEMGVGPTLGQ